MVLAWMVMLCVMTMYDEREMMTDFKPTAFRNCSDLNL